MFIVGHITFLFYEYFTVVAEDKEPGVKRSALGAWCMVFSNVLLLRLPSAPSAVRKPVY
jgi:hypothetical protein